MGEPILDSLRYYDKVRLEATAITREEGSNIDRFTGPEGQDIVLCHLSSIIPFTVRSYSRLRSPFENVATTSLAVHHLNTGDGSLVPEVEGLNDRCKIRFTAEFADSRGQGGEALTRAVAQIEREPGSSTERIPCAFIGGYLSSVSAPMAIVTGILGYPQVSPSSTSPDLQDITQYPLFGRTVPSDQGNAVPIVMYLRDELNIKNLAVINVNDAFGNAFVDGMRTAAKEHAPDMIIHQVPLDEDAAATEAAIRNVKNTGCRFIFALVFSAEAHDKLAMEGYRQGVAGTGVHNWVYGDSFFGILDDRTFEKGSPLHLAYRGSGALRLSGGVAGLADYDKFAEKVAELRNPMDLEYMESLVPTYDHPDYWDGVTVPFFYEEDYLLPMRSGYTPFSYEATIALGLAACDAFEKTESFTGQDHFDHFINTTFSGISGRVAFDQDTGTREARSAFYIVANYVEEEKIDPETGATVVQFVRRETDLFVKGEWLPQNDYVFNDGTMNLPIDLPPPSEPDTVNYGLIVGITTGLAVLLGFIAFLFHENKRKNNDTIWKIEKGEIKFRDPPEMIGSGSFGVVLLGEYRGTQVAVKKVLPTSEVGGGPNPGRSIKTGTVSVSKGHKSSHAGMFRQSQASSLKKMKKEFMDEMRFLSKLRHPSIATIMGAVTTGNDPMLVMEFMEHGSLYDLLHNETMPIETELLLPILSDVSTGVRFLHSADPPVIHGDLKSHNILIDSNFRAKVADFGLSQSQTKGERTGSPFWMAPELLRKESGNTPASDSYSFGIVLYELYSRRDPYEGEDDVDEVLRLIADKNTRKRPPAPRDIPAKVKSMMDECLDDAPEKRPPFEELNTRVKRIDAESAGTTQSKKTAAISLFDLFPRHVAEALRDGRSVEAEHHDCVTIFFSDIVGFTDISSQLPPKKIAEMLDRLYTKFDALSKRHDIFKVETIGDAYVAVANLVKQQPDDHAKRIASFAVEAIVAANKTLVDVDDETKGFVNIRVGFNSGPIVADVVGTTNPRFCLFGDSMNTASRMESNSKENRIHCSKSSAELLEVQYPELPLRPRGRIAIKGKGRMETFWVDEDGEGRRASDVQQELEDMRLSLEKKAELAKLEALVEESSEFEQSESFSAREDKIDIEAPPARAVETGFVEADPEQPLKKTSRSFPHAAPKRVPEHSSETTQEQGLKERLTLYLSNNTNGQSHGDFYFQ